MNTGISRRKWTDLDWALHMETDVNQIANIREFVNQNYEIAIMQRSNDKKFYVVGFRNQPTPSGCSRFIQIFQSPRGHRTPDGAAQYAENKFIPSLKLTDFWAKTLEIPATSLQMLRVPQKIK